MTNTEWQTVIDHLGPFFADDDPYDVLYDIEIFDPLLPVDLDEVREFLAICPPSGL
jgi:hypothetical protein